MLSVLSAAPVRSEAAWGFEPLQSTTLGSQSSQTYRLLSFLRVGNLKPLFTLQAGHPWAGTGGSAHTGTVTRWPGPSAWAETRPLSTDQGKDTSDEFWEPLLSSQGGSCGFAPAPRPRQFGPRRPGEPQTPLLGPLPLSNCTHGTGKDLSQPRHPLILFSPSIIFSLERETESSALGERTRVTSLK